VSRIDPKTGEVVAKIEVGRGAGGIAVDESSGAVWVAGLSLGNKLEDNKLSRIDPETNRVVAEIPISPGGGATSVAVGEGAVWAQSDDGKLLKVDPATNEIAGMVSIGDYSYPPTPHLAVYGGGVWAMVQAEQIRLVQIDPRTVHVVAYKDLRPFEIVAAAPGLAAGGGYIWFSSGDGLARVSP
jgi:virginiamycin B lyase